MLLQSFLFSMAAAFFRFRPSKAAQPTFFEIKGGHFMAFFASAIDTLKILVIALGAGLGAWGVINLLEGYGNDNPGANAHVP